MGAELQVVNVVLAGVNLLSVLTLAFFGGRWAGRVDVRLDHLEQANQGDK